ncbi:MAG: phage tail tube protein [Brevundimonas sp.]|uniref:phage tail tube protein n=1 Tax=Brevundimonas sp. TaxID=1871086 RepID=UPI00391A944A
MAIKTKGNVKLEVNIGGSSPDWEVVPGVFQNEGGGRTVDEIDATDFDSVGNDREYIAGLGDNNNRTFQMHYEPGDAVQEFLRDANIENDVVEFRMTFGAEEISGGETCTFDAFVRNYGDPTGPIDGKLTVSFEIRQTGASVWA